MVVTRSESGSNGWEKAIVDLEKKTDSTNDMLNKLNIQLLTTNEKVSTLNSQLEGKFRRLFWKSSVRRILYGWHPSMSIPTFDVPDTIAWLTRARQIHGFQHSDGEPGRHCDGGLAMVPAFASQDARSLLRSVHAGIDEAIRRQSGVGWL